MDAVAAHAGGRVDDGHQLAPGLNQLEADHQAHVAGAHHQHLLAGHHAMKIHHCLSRPRADDAGQIPAAGGDHIFSGASGYHDVVAFIMYDLAVLHDANLFFTEHADDGGVQLYLYAQLLGPLQQLLSDAVAADLRLVLLGAEELVDLLEQLSARTGVLVKHDYVHALLGRLDGGGQAGRAGPDDDQFKSLHTIIPPVSGSRRTGSEPSSPPPGG